MPYFQVFSLIFLKLQKDSHKTFGTKDLLQMAHLRQYLPEGKFDTQ